MRICFLGDSFVNGTGDDSGLGWVGRAVSAMRTRSLDLTIYNLGIRRDTSTDVAARWCDETERRLPHEVVGRLVFSFGVNDTTLEHGAPRVAPQVSVANARLILSAAHARWPTLMVGPPPIADASQNTRIASLSEAFAEVCRDLVVPYLETYQPLSHVEPWLREATQTDGAHPNAVGYAALAKLVHAWPAWQAWFQP